MKMDMIKNKFGMSLVEIMVALSILTGGAVTFMNLKGKQSDVTKSVVYDILIEEKINEIRQFLSVKSTCDLIITGSGGGTFTPPIGSGAATINAAVAPGLTISEIRIVPTAPGAGIDIVPYELIFTFQKEFAGRPLSNSSRRASAMIQFDGAGFQGCADYEKIATKDAFKANCENIGGTFVDNNVGSETCDITGLDNNDLFVQEAKTYLCDLAMTGGVGSYDGTNCRNVTVAGTVTGENITNTYIRMNGGQDRTTFDQSCSGTVPAGYQRFIRSINVDGTVTCINAKYCTISGRGGNSPGHDCGGGGPPPVTCNAGASRTWVDNISGQSCSGTVDASGSALDSTGPATGSATYTCQANGQWSNTASSSSCSIPITDCPGNRTPSWDNNTGRTTAGLDCQGALPNANYSQGVYQVINSLNDKLGTADFRCNSNGSWEFLTGLCADAGACGAGGSCTCTGCSMTQPHDIFSSNQEECTTYCRGQGQCTGGDFECNANVGSCTNGGICSCSSCSGGSPGNVRLTDEAACAEYCDGNQCNTSNLSCGPSGPPECPRVHCGCTGNGPFEGYGQLHNSDGDISACQASLGSNQVCIQLRGPLRSCVYKGAVNDPNTACGC